MLGPALANFGEMAGRVAERTQSYPQSNVPLLCAPKNMQHAVALHKATTPWATACQVKLAPLASVKKHYKQSDALNLMMTMRYAAMCMQYMTYAVVNAQKAAHLENSLAIQFISSST